MFGKIFFPQKASLGAFLRFALEGAMVVVIFFAALFDFSFGGYGVPALAASRKIKESKVFRFSLFAGFAV
ncbi:MAG: hypothetical protein COX90_02975 [Candidatus Nealsonbacteria bacterium CG_4_10_14_0_2_um_filter_38_17]|uniref:Uncharacterized protein n=2 Tax=Candidatus Nealsoniibacteriota TaxID=1817911 RepID=A0A2M7UXP1_9BACT|nr:MAG: hypothetical protein COX36_04610 [Candidatus Nealsonbacteria bacterium CG23_combo_of_CG06-09_8_20_14_all_38_19]PIZ88744.1 MAG: hypothetical protein COX90_02975 [Candidatus Nealsonbacteria bacterium CG_4_10_14_0_2_um_filter_38_17]